MIRFIWIQVRYLFIKGHSSKNSELIYEDIARINKMRGAHLRFTSLYSKFRQYLLKLKR